MRVEAIYSFFSTLYQYADAALNVAVDYAWGTPLLVLLVGGGLILTLASKLLPFRGARHGLKILRGDFDKEDDPGQISHFQALSTALSSTIGMGNIGGVAIAITQGGPGAVFWMWIAAIVGMATKFFTCTLAVMYRGKDSKGETQGGPMYFIEVGLGKKWRVAAIFFSIFGMFGCLAMFQTNQLAEILYDTYRVPRVYTGIISVALVAVVVLGGIQRIATVASRLVPAMCLIYLCLAVVIVVVNWTAIPGIFVQIFHDAFTGTAAVGGAEGIAFAKVIQTGVKRAAFSNEAGIGTAAMAHGAAKTQEPVREGLVAMIGPFIDTVVICTLTAIVVLSSGQWQVRGIRGAALTAQAFENALGNPGRFALVIIVMLFSLSTMFGYSYYGRKCFSYLFGAQNGTIYDVIYLIMLFGGALWTANLVVNIIDTSFAMMAIPNMIATLILAPRVLKATRVYFAKYKI